MRRMKSTNTERDSPTFHRFKNNSSSFADHSSTGVTSTPVLIDITAPQNPYAVINHGAFMTNSPDVVVTISATDLRSALAERWRRFLPETPMAYLTRWQLQLGAQMLTSTNSGVVQIASKVGYESEASFNRAFK